MGTGIKTGTVKKSTAMNKIKSRIADIKKKTDIKKKAKIKKKLIQ